MDAVETLKAVGSAAGFSALLTSLFNLYTLRKQHARLLEVEIFKKKSALDTFRYTKLFEASAEIQALPPVNYDLSNMKSLVTQTTERHGRVERIYRRIQPLITVTFRERADRAAGEEQVLSKKLIAHLYAGGQDAPLKELLLKRQEFEQVVVATISAALTAMTVSEVA